MENKSIHIEILVREFVDSFFKNNTKWSNFFNNQNIYNKYNIIKSFEKTTFFMFKFFNKYFKRAF